MEKGVILAKNIEMNVQGSDGSYEVLYPQSVSDIILNSDFLLNLWNLSNGSDIDEAFDYLDKKLILMQYGKAGVNITCTSPGGNPMQGIKINNISPNYDGIGDNFCITDEQGKCFGYCNAGNVSLSFPNYLDCDVNNNSNYTFNAVESQMYNINIPVTKLDNYWGFTASTNNIAFSGNCERVDVTCVGGGGGGAGGERICVGGGGGYCTVQELVSFNINQNYDVIVGSGGSVGENQDGRDGGQTSFLNIVANGGGGGNSISHYLDEDVAGIGNGNGGWCYETGTAAQKHNATEGTVLGYSSFTETYLYGGGGGGCYGITKYDYWQGSRSEASSNGGASTTSREADPGKMGTGGGGGAAAYDNRPIGGEGGSGYVGIRMHLKVTS